MKQRRLSFKKWEAGEYDTIYIEDHLLRDTNGEEYNYVFVQAEYDKIRKRQKEIYEERVEAYFLHICERIEEYIAEFGHDAKRINNTLLLNLNKLLRSDYNGSVNILAPQIPHELYTDDLAVFKRTKEPLKDDGEEIRPVSNVEFYEFSGQALSDIRKYYNSIFEFGIRDYSLTESTSGNKQYVFSDFKYIQVEAFERYRIHLTELQERGGKKRLEDTKNLPLIVFDSQNSFNTVLKQLSHYFYGREKDLIKALEGEILEESLVLPFEQNKLVEYFKRLEYNSKLTTSKRKITDWLCWNFSKGSEDVDRSISPDYVYNIISKGLSEPPRKNIICDTEWLTYYPHNELYKLKRKT